MYPHVYFPLSEYSPKETLDTLSAVLVILGVIKPSSPLVLSTYPIKIRSSFNKYLPEDTSSLNGFFIFCLRTSKFSFTLILKDTCSSGLVVSSSLGTASVEVILDCSSLMLSMFSDAPSLERSFRVSSDCSAANTICDE